MFASPAKSSTPISVQGFSWTLEEGNLTGGVLSGTPWFGVSALNLSGTANGYPIQVAPGTDVTVYLFLRNLDSQSHSIVLAQMVPPLRVVNSTPALPAVIAPGQDVWFGVTIQIEGTAGSSTFGHGSLGFV